MTDVGEITTSGSDGILKVDADGARAGASFVQIATLEVLTGLTNEAVLEVIRIPRTPDRLENDSD
jgi:hypothetical protein